MGHWFEHVGQFAHGCLDDLDHRRTTNTRTMNTTELFLIALTAVFALPYMTWRLCKTDSWMPLVVVQIITGVLLGPGILGHFAPGLYNSVFTPAVMTALNGVAWWAVSLFVFTAGIELNLRHAWQDRVGSSVTAAFALGVPLITGCAAAFLLIDTPGWEGSAAHTWQFVLGIGMACAVTALPILLVLLEKMGLLRTDLGQRVIRYASLDDVLIWSVLAVILMDWTRVGQQAAFLVCYAGAAVAMRKYMPKLPVGDRWSISIIWLVVCAMLADWCGLHFMVGAFLAGVIIDSEWFDQRQLDTFRHTILLVMMPVFFLSTGLKTSWTMGGYTVLAVAALLFAAQLIGKHIGVYVAGRVLAWPKGDNWTIGWLLQTKALIEIIFANVLLDKKIITSEMFTALLLMAIASTMITMPMIRKLLPEAK